MIQPLDPARGRRLAWQRRVTAWLAPALAVLCVAWMRARGFRLEGARESRALFARLRRESDAPILVCANHLTLVDSLLVAWALGDARSYLRDPGALPWNTPETRNFAAGPGQRLLAWLSRCLPVTRGGDRAEVSLALARVGAVLSQGDVVLMFPEGGRSRSGRVDPESGSWGVGRLVRALPQCRVLCVYLRGEQQDTWSALPARGERFRVRVRTLEPKAAGAGLRASVETARQITRALAALEADVLGPPPADARA